MSSPRVGRTGVAGAWMVALALIAGFLSLQPTTPAHAAPTGATLIDAPLDGVVYDVESAADGTRYMGGSFTRVGAATGTGAAITRSTGVVDRNFPAVVGGGGIVGAISDGAGGFYIGGLFTSVGGVPRTNIAHITATGQVDPNFVVKPSSEVRSFALSADGKTLYVGGVFSRVNDTDRNLLAAVDAKTGALKPWNPIIAGTGVDEMAIQGTTLYVGGRFTSVNASPNTANRNGLASFDMTDATGAATSWNPAPTLADGTTAAATTSIAVSGSMVYFGGTWANFYGSPRGLGAAWDTTADALSAWNPAVTTGTDIKDMLVANSKVYMVGVFTSVNGTTRNRAAAVDASTGALDATWNPNLGGRADAIGKNGSTIYLSGSFTTAGGSARNRAAAVDDVNGTLTSWDPNTNGDVWAMVVTDDYVYLGGSLTGVNQVTRLRAAAFDANGLVTAWNPAMNNNVNEVELAGTKAYLGGSFTNTSQTGASVARNRLAAFDQSGAGALDTSWNPNVTGNVSALEIVGSTLYAGGTFTLVKGVTRTRLAAMNLTDATLDDTWVPTADQPVQYLGAVGSGASALMYIGGSFTSISGTGRNMAAAVNLTSGAVDSGFNPDVTGGAGPAIQSIAVSGSTAYLAGSFTTVNTSGASPQTRNRLASVATATGTATDWNPNANNSAFDIAVSSDGKTVYAGGTFSQVNGVTRANLAAWDTATGAALNWTPAPASAVYVVRPGASSVLIAGQFTSITSFGTVPGQQRYGDVVPATALPSQPSATKSGTKATWLPAMAGGVKTYVVMYRVKDSGKAWAMYATGTANTEVSITNPGTKNTCSAANTTLGWTSCPMPYGWRARTTYEFGVFTTNTNGKNSSGPITSQFTFTTA